MRIDPKTKLMNDAWRKAYKDGEINITLPSASDVHNIRFALYNAAKLAKQRESEDYELFDAVTNCSIQILKDKKTLRIYRHDKSALMGLVAEALGVEIGKPAGEQVDEEANAMLERMGLATGEVKQSGAVADAPATASERMQRYANIRSEG